MNDQVTNAGAPQPDSTGKSAAEMYPNLIGCKGWLRFLWFWLVLLVPIVNGIMIIQEWSSLEGAANSIGGLNEFVILETIIILVLCVLSIRAGLKLSSIAKDAVKAVKTFILAWFCAQVLLVILVAVVIEDVSGKDEFIGKMFGRLAIQAVIYFLGWWMYLKKSLRVKATFPPDTAAPAPGIK